MAGTSSHRGKPASEAELRRMVAEGMSARQIGAALDISTNAAMSRLAARGIRLWRRGPRPFDPRAVLELYAAGVNIIDIAEHFGVSVKSIRNKARDAGIPRRPFGSRGKRLADYQQEQLAARMAETARQEQAQIKLAEMWDQPGTHISGKGKAA